MMKKKTQASRDQWMANLLGVVLASTAMMSYTSPSIAANGEAIYKKACRICHGTGIGGAPKFGDASIWAPRIAKGIDVLEDHAIKGFNDRGIMPPRGGRPNLSDDEVKAAVAYMVNG